MKTVLITAYAVNPYKGSEDGTGWNFISQVALHYKVIAITRENNEVSIKKYKEEKPNDPIWSNLEFFYFDLPYWMRFWKRGPRGSGIYYYLWQLGIVYFIRKQKFQFDLTHSLNFHSDSHPTFLWMLHKPVIWGPVGHHPMVPKQFMRRYGWSMFFQDRIYFIGKKLMQTLDPFLKLAAKKARYILPINSDAAKVFHVQSDKLVILPAIGSVQPSRRNDPIEKNSFIIISVGRFVPMKGFDLAIDAFLGFYKKLSPAECKKVMLYLVGQGPEEKRLRDLLKGRSGADQISFISWVDHHEMKKLYEQSSVFLFPSHEGAGMVTVEALSYGIPVVCLKNAGPGEIVSENCAIAVPVLGLTETIDALAEALLTLFRDQIRYQALSKGALEHFNKNYHWPAKVRKLISLYEIAMTEREIKNT